MRRGNNPAIRRTASGAIESINLGADYCAEHEMGIENLERAFGLQVDAPAGIERRRVHLVPRGLHFDASSHTVSYVPYGDPDDGELQFWRLQEVPEVVTAWSEGDFAVRFRDDCAADARDLDAAFRHEDIAFLFGNTHGNPFARAGLVLAIISQLPDDIVDNLREMTLDADALAAAAAATGIEARIRDASHWGSRDYDRRYGFYALSPRWKDDTKTEVLFWLNPADQEHVNFGWFSVADLDTWLAGSGPVLDPALRKR